MTASETSQIMSAYEKRRLPPMIILDITNLCNLKCVHCPQPILQAKPGFSPRFLPWESFVKIVDEIDAVQEPALLRFVGDGEPLLHPHIVAMIERAARSPHIITNLTTNGTVLNAKMIGAIAGVVDLIDISLDAVTRPTYEKVRVGGNYKRVMRNLFALLDAVAKKGVKTKTMVSFITQQENEAETDLFRSFYEPLVDYVMIRSLHSASGQVKNEESRQRSHADTIERYACPHLWKRLTVDFLGRIKFCAHDWESGSTLGDISSVSLEEVWRGAILNSLRGEHKQNRYSDNICGPCGDWAATRWDYGYEKLIDKVVVGRPLLFPFKTAAGPADGDK